MNIIYGDSHPDAGSREQSTFGARTSVESKDDYLIDLNAANEISVSKATILVGADALSVNQLHSQGRIVEQTQHVLKHQGNVCEEANKRRRVLNILQDSFHNNQEYNNAKNCPYVPMNVEEVSVVKSLKLWTNPNVRVIGKFVPTNPNFTLCGVGEDEGEITLNVENLDQYPKHGDIVEVFGTLCIGNQNICENADNSLCEPAPPINLKVMFCRSLFDVRIYKKGLTLVKPFIPLFVRRD